jgi:hypothetical protein
MRRKMAPQNFNDLLCLVLVVMIMAAWILEGLKLVELPAEITGALIVTWTLMVQHYFRKSKTNAAAGTSSAAADRGTEATPPAKTP